MSITTNNKNKTASGDILWSQEIYGTDGSVPVLAGRIKVVADAQASDGAVAGKMIFETATSGGVMTEALSLNSSQVAAFAGAQTFTGLATFTLMPKIPAATVAAAGNAQSNAAAITTGFTLVTGADDAKGVKLPSAEAGLVCIIKVGPGADLKVYPNTDDAINKGAADAAITVVDDVCFMLIAYDDVDWYTLPLLPS